MTSIAAGVELPIPNMLCGLATALHQLESDPTITTAELTSWLLTASDRLADDPAEDAVWQIDPSILRARVIEGVPDWPPSPPADVTTFTTVVRLLQLLDRWHRPLSPPLDMVRRRRSDAHELAADHMSEHQCLASDATGLLIAGCAWGHPPHDMPGLTELEDEPSLGLPAPYGRGRPMLLRRLLEATAYVPRSIAMPGSDERITLRYAVATAPRSLPPPTRPLRIAIAPLLETLADVRVDISPANRRYCVRPVYDRARLAAVLRQAMAEEVELLFLPESSVDAANLVWLREQLLAIGREHYAVAAALPRLRYVFAGVHAPLDTTAVQNMVVVLDAEGNELARQHKMFPWNLDADQIDRYGLAHACGITGSHLDENIHPGREVIILDLSDIGRLVSLICADVWADVPGDWLFAHVRADWLNAPIMDMTTVSPQGPHGFWITRRAWRAARILRGRVVVSNSMPFTWLLNAANARSGKRPAVRDCGIGFLVDATEGAPVVCDLLAGLGSMTPILVAADWRDGWAAMPPPQPPAALGGPPASS